MSLFAEGLTLSGLDGLPAFQQRATADPVLAPILKRWQEAVGFYLSRGIRRIPTGLVADLGGAGVSVDFSRTQSQIDASAAAAVQPPAPSGGTDSTGTGGDDGGTGDSGGSTAGTGPTTGTGGTEPTTGTCGTGGSGTTCG